MTLLFSTFDPSALGPLLALEQGNTILLTTRNANEFRSARCLYGKDTSQWFAEFAAWGDDDIDGAYFGVLLASASLSDFVGNAVGGYSYRPLNGWIFEDGTGIATVATAAKGDVIGIWVKLGDGTSPTITWFKNGEAIHTAELNDPGPWYPAATTSGPTAGGLKVWINSGQRDFDYPLPGSSGWFRYPEAVPAVLVGTEDYISPSDDPIPNVVWEGRIADDGVEIVSELAFWVDGKGRSTRGGATTVQLTNGDGALDWLMIADPRDLVVNLQTVLPRETFENAASIATMTLGGVKATDPGILQVSLVSSMQLLDQALQTKIFPPSADPVVAGKPWPIVEGAARQITPVLIDPVNRIYALSDVAVAGWGYIRDKGAPLDPAAFPPGYVISADLRTVTLETNPIGKLTADVSSVGGGTLPVLADDIWSSKGNPFTNDHGFPAGFDVRSNVTYAATSKALFTSPSLAGSAYIGMAAATCLTGRNYRYRVVVDLMPGPHAYGTPVLAIVTGTGVPKAVFTAAGTYEGTFTTGSDFSPRLMFSSALTSSSAIVSNAYILEIPDTYTPADINPITLADFMRDIIEMRAKRDQSFYSVEDAEAIDATTGYAGIGYFEDGAATVRDAIDAVLPSYTSCAYIDENNGIRVIRLTDPELETSLGEITEDDLLSELTVTPDLAPGLSTQARFRRNWTILDGTDFVTDYMVVTGATRRALSQSFQGIVASAIALGPAYEHAVYGDPIGFLLDSQENAQAEIDHVVGYYAGRTRFFFEMEVSEELGVKLGDIRTLINPRYGLSAGKKLLVCKTVRRPIAGTVKITLRG